MKIISITVTYNRFNDLVKNIESVCGQKIKPEVVIIVDNNSSDGTEEKITEYIEKYPIIKYIRLNENTGGAGGFYVGVKEAGNYEYDYLWLMDDDGRPDSDCLYNLINSEYCDIKGPLIYSTNELLHTEILIDGKKTNKIIDAESKKVLPIVHPFNGTLIARKVIEKIGNVNKNLFIWGDEQEYRLRWIKNGFKECTITSARYFHPENRLTLNKKLIFLKIPNIAQNRKYIFYRNQAYIDINCRPKIAGIMSIIRWVMSIILLEKNKALSLYGLINGLLGDLRAPHIR